MTNNSYTLLECAHALRTVEITPQTYLEEITNRFDTVEQDIKAFLPEEDRWSRLDTAVSHLESRFPQPDRRPPLYGVPVGVKDIFSVDGFNRKAGSEVPAAALAGSESPIVTQLKNAGALILGRTVTTEFAHADPGPTRNPHNLAHTPGGSSSGSAAAVAGGLCPLALGSQTIGSVARPAAFCGVVGVKPSYERVNMNGVFPVAPSVDTAGYFTNDIAGAQLAAGVIYDDWRANDKPTNNCTIGAVEGSYLSQASVEAQEQFETHLAKLTEAGYDIRRVQPFDDIEAINERHQRLVAAEMALSQSELYPQFGDQYAPETVELIQEGKNVSIEELSAARRGRTLLRERIHTLLNEQSISVLVSPSAVGAAPEGIDSTGNPIMNLPWSHAGVPTVTLPASQTEAGLPIGLQCAGRYGRDEWLLSWSEGIATALDD